MLRCRRFATTAFSSTELETLVQSVGKFLATSAFDGVLPPTILPRSSSELSPTRRGFAPERVIPDHGAAAGLVGAPAGDGNPASFRSLRRTCDLLLSNIDHSLPLLIATVVKRPRRASIGRSTRTVQSDAFGLRLRPYHTATSEPKMRFTTGLLPDRRVQCRTAKPIDRQRPVWFRDPQ